MTEDLHRLAVIEAAIGLVRAAHRETPFELPATVTPEEVLTELAGFCAAQTAIAAVALNSTPEAEFDDYLSRATDLLGAKAPVVSLHPKEAGDESVNVNKDQLEEI